MKIYYKHKGGYVEQSLWFYLDSMNLILMEIKRLNKRYPYHEFYLKDVE